jgi:hypothetical protein
MRLLLSTTIVVSLSHLVLGRAPAPRPEETKETNDTRLKDSDAAVLVQRFEQWTTAELRKMDPVGELYLQPDSGEKSTDSYSGDESSRRRPTRRNDAVRSIRCRPMSKNSCRRIFSLTLVTTSCASFDTTL